MKDSKDHRIAPGRSEGSANMGKDQEGAQQDEQELCIVADLERSSEQATAFRPSRALNRSPVRLEQPAPGRSVEDILKERGVSYVVVSSNERAKAEAIGKTRSSERRSGDRSTGPKKAARPASIHDKDLDTPIRKGPNDHKEKEQTLMEEEVFKIPRAPEGDMFHSREEGSILRGMLLEEHKRKEEPRKDIAKKLKADHILDVIDCMLVALENCVEEEEKAKLKMCTKLFAAFKEQVLRGRKGGFTTDGKSTEDESANNRGNPRKSTRGEKGMLTSQHQPRRRYDVPTEGQASKMGEKRKLSFNTPPTDNRSEKRDRKDSPPEDRAEETWAKVVAKRKVRQKKDRHWREDTGSKEKGKTSVGTRDIGNRAGKPPPTRGDAIIIPLAGDNAYKEVVMKLRKEVGTTIDKFKRVRRTKGGNLLVELTKQANTDIILEKVKTTIKENEGIRKLSPKMMPEIKDLDSLTSKDEILDALNKIDAEKAKGIADYQCRLKRGPMGTQIASIECPETVARKALQSGKIRIGLALARGKLVPKITRCYGCHGFGHHVGACQAKNGGRETCRRCGEMDHNAGDCKNPFKCTLCEKNGLKSTALGHLAGGERCPVYKKEVEKLTRKING